MDMKPPFSSPVKEYSEEYYIFDEDGKQVLDKKTTWKYNGNNQISEIHQINSDKEYSEMSYYTYDDDQNLKQVIIKVAEGEQKKALIYEYQDNLLDQIREIAGDYKSVTKYDDFGNPSEKRSYTRDDVLISTTMYVNLYENNGKLAEKHTLFPSGDHDWIDKFQYNDAGLLIEEQKIRNQLVSVIKHSYNEKGDLILSDFNPGQPNHELLKREISYGLNNDILEVKEYRKGWCYQDRNDEFGLTAVIKYTYFR
jgi:hypothetical protein